MRGRRTAPGETEPATSARAGLTELFHREYDPMFRLAHTMLGSEREAEEVTQAAFLAVADRWDRLDNPGGYLRVCVVNGARKQMRTRRRRAVAEARVRASATSTRTAPNDYLLDAIDALPERQRVAVVLTYYAGLDSTDAAELMGCRPATVRSLLRHALEHLRGVVER